MQSETWSLSGGGRGDAPFFQKGNYHKKEREIRRE